MEEQATAERRHRSALVVGAVAALLVVASAGFIAGRGTASDSSKADSCRSVKAAMDRLVKEGKDAPADEAQAVKYRRLGTVMNVVLQNPDCYSADTRAEAQTLKDQLAANAQSTAASNAAARAAQCAENRWSWLPC